MIKEAKITYLTEAERDEVKFWNSKSFEEKLSIVQVLSCLLYTSPSPRDRTRSRMPSSA